MKRLKKSAVILIVLCLIVASTACSTSGGSVSQDKNPPASSTGGSAEASGEKDWTKEEIHLSIIHEHTAETAVTVASSRMYLRVQDEFAAAHPNVKLDVTALGSSEVFERLTVLAASDELPDVVYLNNAVFDAVKEDNMLLDVTEYFDKNFYRDNLRTFSYNGAVYGVPIKYTTYNYMYYNSELWKEAGYDKFPSTWDEVLKANEFFKSKGIPTILFANKLSWFALASYFNAIMHEICGTEWVEAIGAKDGSASFTDDRLVEALEKFATLRPLWNPDFISADDQWAVAELAKGKAGAHISGSWVAGSIKAHDKENPGIADIIRVAPVPTFTGVAPTVDYAVPQGFGLNVKVAKDEMKKQAAIAFLQFLGTDRYSRYMAEVGEMGPVEVNVDMSGLKPMQQDMFAVMNSHKNVPQITYNLHASVARTIDASLASFLSGSITAKECAAEIQRAYEAQLP
ncbi:MAG: extracellular solute-binding protein [Clostridiaceae bacterium]|nr:extracellular solute-binding protein [Clostridiaceae bacterium]